ncbi:hypothetical protein Ocin01_06021 [Orchesella cincta]|uniref:EF-hand domain-containing protein n=1 Tax=Orchesella cincta TaxID=48709 RepID=A0A1D2N608_ORCCI|nr:hypothetical protein Ocin01_06021 [Orchesella cincta]
METEKDTCMRPKWMTKLLGCSHKGGIHSHQLPALLTELNPGLNIDEVVLKVLIKENDRNGSGVLDFDTVTKILFQLILKQPCNESSELDSSCSESDEECSCSSPGACSMKITDFIIFPTL